MPTEALAQASNRRKVRKGTQSCWQCKRRKTRCTFVSPNATVCDGCRSRGTECLSQQYSETHIQPGMRAKRAAYPQVEQQPKLRSNRGLTYRGHEEATPEANQAFSLDVQVTSSLADISQALVKVWPIQSDLDILFNVPVDTSILLHGVVCKPYAKCIPELIEEPRKAFQLPPTGSHPVLIGRQLLLLSIFMQAILPSQTEKLSELSTSHHTMMSHLVFTANRLVTSNDDILMSIDGIECVMIESMFLNNAGNLRKAWLVNRRAMNIAQTLGLHAAEGASGLVLEKRTCDRVDPTYMWFRLIATDRYLSLMLGLPFGCVQNSFTCENKVASCDPLDQMERRLAMAAGSILQRSDPTNEAFAETLRIDKMLQDAAALMPPKWWSITILSNTTDKTKSFEETIRVMMQFAFFHLVIRLHLPYMLHIPGRGMNYDSSTLTTAHASRTILTNFVSFRKSRFTTAYCRGVDFIILVACTTLSLAHIQSRNSLMENSDQRMDSLWSLQHCRLSDRALLEETFEIMEVAGRQNKDAVVARVLEILRPVLKAENDSAQGISYHPNITTTGNKQAHEGFGIRVENSGGLCIQIPHLGTIRFDQQLDSLVGNDHGLPGKENHRAAPFHTETSNSQLDVSSIETNFGAPDHNLDRALIYHADEPFSDFGGYDWGPQSVDMALYSIFTNDSGFG